jgi:hypothetical protein
LLGTASDAQTAKVLNRTEEAIRAKREKLGIPNFIRQGSDWTRDEERFLGTKPDCEVAHILQRSLTAIRTRRCLKRIPPFEPKGRKWTSDEDQLLGTLDDATLASRLGRTLISVRKRRIRLGIENSSRAWSTGQPMTKDCLGLNRTGNSQRSWAGKRVLSVFGGFSFVFQDVVTRHRRAFDLGGPQEKPDAFDLGFMIPMHEDRKRSRARLRSAICSQWGWPRASCAKRSG